MDVIDLVSPASPPPEPWFSRAVRAAGAELAEHGRRTRECSPAGVWELRAAVAERYARRGVPTEPEQILVTAGAGDAYALLARELCAAGDRVVVEWPGDPRPVRAVRAAGAEVVPAGMLDHGWDLAVWARSLRVAAPRLACVAPDFQQPTGLLMPEDQRRALVALAAATGVTLVVDETSAGPGPAPTGARPPAPLAMHDPGGTVVGVGSADGALWAGLRIGWVRGTPPLVRRLAARRAGGEPVPGVPGQLVVRRLLCGEGAPGADECAFARQRARTREGRDVLVAALRRRMPAWSFRVPEGGPALWVRTGGRSAEAYAARAERQGVRLAPGTRFGAGVRDVGDVPGLREVHPPVRGVPSAPGARHGRLEGFLRIAFTQPPEVLEEAVRRIAAVPPP
ncbi:aminotransferase class I/II-fold pyridoxal phosphate-dependent enzyme [Streptomyces sp. NPDC002004]